MTKYSILLFLLAIRSTWTWYLR